MFLHKTKDDREFCSAFYYSKTCNNESYFRLIQFPSLGFVVYFRCIPERRRRYAYVHMILAFRLINNQIEIFSTKGRDVK